MTATGETADSPRLPRNKNVPVAWQPRPGRRRKNTDMVGSLKLGPQPPTPNPSPDSPAAKLRLVRLQHHDEPLVAVLATLVDRLDRLTALIEERLP